MKKCIFWISGFAATAFFILSAAPTAFAQNSDNPCSGTLLAMNTTTISRTPEARKLKRPCTTKGKRINQSPRTPASGYFGYYNNVAIDQLGDTFINTYPGLGDEKTTTGPQPDLTQEHTKAQKLTVCQKSNPKDCKTKKEETPAKRLRPSATVKLIKYEINE